MMNIGDDIYEFPLDGVYPRDIFLTVSTSPSG